MSDRWSAVARAAVAVPPIVAALTLVALMVTERAGGTLFADLYPRNSAESAGMAHAASLMQYLEEGADPARVHEVDAAIISSAVLRATTLEAAVWSRQVGIIELLDYRGAFRDDRRRQAIACLAADLKASDIAEYLTRPGDPACVPQAEYERVLRRTAVPPGAQ